MLRYIQGVRIFDRQRLTSDRPRIFMKIELGTYCLKVLNFQDTGCQSVTFTFEFMKRRVYIIEGIFKLCTIIYPTNFV